MLKRLTYGNVMSTLAVFIALGGSAVAITKISGSQIVNRSIPGTKIKTRSLTSKEVRSASFSTRTKSLVVSKGRNHGSRRSTEPQLTKAATGGAGEVLKLNRGGSATLLQSDPFTLKMACSSGNGGRSEIAVWVETEIDGTLVGNVWPSGSWTGSNKPLKSLDRGEKGMVMYPSPMDLSVMVPVLMLTPSGQQFRVEMFGGTDGLGADCYAAATAFV